MIHSMTGFGRGEASSNEVSVTVEIKSVNNRYLNISFRVPPEIQQNELALKEQILAKIQRGKLSINIRVDSSRAGVPEITINAQLAKGYKQVLEELRRSAQINEPVSLSDLMTFDDIFTAREQDEETLQKIYQLSNQALQHALDDLIEMRRQEGGELQKDLLERVNHINDKMIEIKDLTKNRAAENRDKLLANINKLVDDETLDEERLEMEVAILADKSDITEEIVRLQSHIKYFKEALQNEKSVGRRLKFLSQEMNREINTIGSKADDVHISNHVVAAKESLEQIKEQVANVE